MACLNTHEKMLEQWQQTNEISTEYLQWRQAIQERNLQWTIAIKYMLVFTNMAICFK